MIRLACGVVLLLQLLSCSLCVAADDIAWTPPRGVTKQFTNELPGTWTSEINGPRLVLRPREQPSFVNTIGASAQLTTETLGEYNQRYKVTFDYQIALRFEPKLSFQDVRRLMNGNVAILYALTRLEESPLAGPGKGVVHFPDTAEGHLLSDQHAQLVCSFRSVPIGYLDEVSVYLEPTHLGYAYFLHEDQQQECEAVRKLIIDQVSPYRPETPNARGASKPTGKE